MKSLYKTKKILRAAITIMDGEKEIETYFSTDYRLGKVLNDIKGDSALLIYDGDFDLDKDEDYKYENYKNSVPWLVIHYKDVPTFINTKRSVATCAFNATSDFMTHQLGRKLDSYDRDWYEQNNLVTVHGLPQKNSFIVIQQLVEPYGLGIKNITIPRNSQRFPEYKPFMLGLGMNPFFAVDGRTTNEEALERLFPDKDLRDKNRDRMLANWRFECSDEPYKGAIVMRVFDSGSFAGSHNGGSSYEGPRTPNKNGAWEIAIKLDRLDNISYRKPITLPEYEKFSGISDYDWWKIVVPSTGKTLDETSKNTSFSYSGIKYNGDGIANKNNKDSEAEKVWAHKDRCEVCDNLVANSDNSSLSYATAYRACPYCFAYVLREKVPVENLLKGYSPIEEDELYKFKPTYPGYSSV